MKQYFIHDGQNEKGPYDIQKLRTENLKKDTPVWYDGLENWTTAGEVEELKSLMTLKPPPINPTLPKIETPPKIEQIAVSRPLETKTIHPKKSYQTEIIISISVIVIGIIGWLIYQNRNQSESLNQVQEKVTQQDQQLNQQNQALSQQQLEQQQKEQEQLLEQQQKQDEKDRVNAVLTEKYMGFRNNWKSFISADHNEFSVGVLGGISDLYINVYNNTDKSIDEIQVQVEYMRSGGASTGTQIVSVTNIGPNSSKTVSAPDGAGSRVSEEIISVSARSFHFCFPYGMEGNKNLDPYFCK